jgi:RNA polymerase sigma factor (TIGR02999 family)
LFGGEKTTIENRVHFFALAATVMRQIIINYAEQKNTRKRGGDWQRVTLEEDIEKTDQNTLTLLAVNDALKELAEIDEDLARLVELRFFSGMTEQEIATLYSVSDRTVRRNWQKAKLLLIRALEKD